MKMNALQLSDFFGVSRQLIYDWKKRGAPIDSGDASKVAKWYVKQRAVAPVISEQRARLLKSQAEKAELIFDEKSGLLHNAHKCHQEGFAEGRRIRDSILNVPDRMDAILAAETSRSGVRKILRDELIFLLKSLSEGERDEKRTGKDCQ